jgi:hypothetical protein
MKETWKCFDVQGKEVVKMYDTILGQEGFRKGMDLYFQRHDGCAVTCDDFLAAMADANDEDLTSLGRWCAFLVTGEEFCVRILPCVGTCNKLCVSGDFGVVYFELYGHVQPKN